MFPPEGRNIGSLAILHVEGQTEEVEMVPLQLHSRRTLYQLAYGMNKLLSGCPEYSILDCLLRSLQLSAGFS